MSHRGWNWGRAKRRPFSIHSDSAITFFDKGIRKETVEKGHVYVSGSFMKQMILKRGDVIA